MSRTKSKIELEAARLGMEFTDYLDYVWELQDKSKDYYYDEEEVYDYYGQDGSQGSDGSDHH